MSMMAGQGGRSAAGRVGMSGWINNSAFGNGLGVASKGAWEEHTECLKGVPASEVRRRRQTSSLPWLLHATAIKTIKDDQDEGRRQKVGCQRALLIFPRQESLVGRTFVASVRSADATGRTVAASGASGTSTAHY